MKQFLKGAVIGASVSGFMLNLMHQEDGAQSCYLLGILLYLIYRDMK